MTQTQRPFEGRSTFIDGLRGIAALSVACYHIDRYGPVPVAAEPAIPRWLISVIDHGSIGVQVFFVISGFVIAYSVRNARITPGYLANYVLRRAIRLDPPYWTTILFVLAVLAIVPLAALLSHATEAVAAKTGDAVGGLLNATLGNLTELIIAVTALLW